ncbi:hypothetical protein [Paenibacillus terrae]|uniref:Uncharacterized protein n=1 Tax=Paenibacillus terrae TaxID=159743 RepID=A0A0D7WVD6_9BACL|nr:hypothetical protein [Paenibacillus terrae]KJD42683.1 hypothetical protein QD47_26835 [Paenibacillus terrae]
MLDKLKYLLYYLFPFFENYFYKKKMMKKIKDTDNKSIPLSYMDGYEKLSIVEMDKLHSKSFEYKKSLEDKAKTSLFSVSISITLIVSFIDLIFRIEYFRTLAMLLVVVAFTNLILAGKMAFDVIGNLNVFSDLFPSDFHLKKKDKKELLAYATESNVNYNIIRNNHVYLSYKSIMVSLVAIALVGILYMVGKGMSSSKPDIQTEVLLHMNTNSQQTLSSLNDIADNFEKISESFAETQKTLDQMKDVLNGFQTEYLSNQDDSIKENY